LFIWSDVTDTTAGDFLYVTNVQLEKGTQATSFDYRPYGTELQLCQRYFQYAVGQYMGPAISGQNNGGGGQFLVEMRAAPTVTWVSSIGQQLFPSGAPTALYISTTTRNFWPFKMANGTGQDGRFHDNYAAAIEL
jgi:hypothetical protein